MKNMIALLMLFLVPGIGLFAQVGINAENSPPDNSAMLDVKSTSRGFLPPRMTSSQMIDIVLPQEGLMIYNTTTKSICVFDGTSWTSSQSNDGKPCGTVLYGGQTYNSVIMGVQCWMTTNLNIGTAIPGIQEQSDNAVLEKYCYADNSSNCDLYGGLYQWGEMVQYLNGGSNSTLWNPVPAGTVQGICPAGWHLPGDAEWTALTDYLGGGSVAGGKLKEAGTTNWVSPNTGATNSTGFTALPGGFRSVDGTFHENVGTCRFMTPTSDLYNYWYRELRFNSNGVIRDNNFKKIGESVRCVKN